MITPRHVSVYFVVLCIAVSANVTLAQEDTSRNKEVHVRLSGSLHYPSWEGDSPPIAEHLFENRFAAQAEVDLFLFSNVSVSAALLFQRTRDRNANFICPSVPPCWTLESSDSFSLLLPELRIKYHRPRENSDLYVGVGAGYGFGRIASIERRYSDPGQTDFSDSVKERFHAGGFDFALLTGLSYDVHKNLATFLEFGYRRFTTGDFKNNSDGPPEKFDATGPFSTIGLSCRL